MSETEKEAALLAVRSNVGLGGADALIFILRGALKKIHEEAYDRAEPNRQIIVSICREALYRTETTAPAMIIDGEVHRRPGAIFINNTPPNAEVRGAAPTDRSKSDDV